MTFRVPRGQWEGEHYKILRTYYTSLGLMGKSTPLGEMFERRDLRELVAAGHELACHTHDHVLCCDLSRRELQVNCEENQASMAKMLNGYQSRSFSFPEGVVTVAAKALLGSRYECCRTIEPGINCDPIDLAFLRANRLYSTSPIKDLEDLITRNHREKGWLILYTHDISASPSRWGCTPERFQAVMESGAEVLPVCEAKDRFVSADSSGLN